MSDKPPVVQVIEAAQKLSDPEMRQVLEFLGQEYKLRLERADQMAVLALGDAKWVEMAIPGKKLPAGAKGHIVKIRRGRVQVHFSEHGMWTVSAAALRKTDPPAEVPK